MRAENYNRKYTKRNKVIRDRKKANVVGRRRLEGDKVIEIPLTKKETKKQEKIKQLENEVVLEFKLKTGKNTIKLQMPSTSSGGNHVMYDYISLEGDLSTLGLASNTITADAIIAYPNPTKGILNISVPTNTPSLLYFNTS